jgi:galactokinase/mevalonate kinase-like predicted kinase
MHMARQIVNEHTERLYACALHASAYCARISGGSGGFMMFLTDPVQKDQAAPALRASRDGGEARGCHFTGVGVRAWRRHERSGARSAG